MFGKKRQTESGSRESRARRRRSWSSSFTGPVETLESRQLLSLLGSIGGAITSTASKSGSTIASGATTVASGASGVASTTASALTGAGTTIASGVMSGGAAEITYGTLLGSAFSTEAHSLKSRL